MQNNINYFEYHKITNGVIFIDDLKVTFHDNKSHGIESYMIKLETKDNIIVYTSDIGNTNMDNVIDFSKNADLLICESSLLVEDSNSKVRKLRK